MSLSAAIAANPRPVLSWFLAAAWGLTLALLAALPIFASIFAGLAVFGPAATPTEMTVSGVLWSCDFSVEALAASSLVHGVVAAVALGLGTVGGRVDARFVLAGTAVATEVAVDAVASLVSLVAAEVAPAIGRPDLAIAVDLLGGVPEVLVVVTLLAALGVARRSMPAWGLRSTGSSARWAPAPPDPGIHWRAATWISSPSSAGSVERRGDVDV